MIPLPLFALLYLSNESLESCLATLTVKVTARYLTVFNGYFLNGRTRKQYYTKNTELKMKMAEKKSSYM